MINAITINQLDYWVGHYMVILPNVALLGVLVIIEHLALDRHCDWAMRRAKLSGNIESLFLIVSFAFTWLSFLLLGFYLGVQALLVTLSFLPSFLPEVDHFLLREPIFPLIDYSQYTRYFIDRESHITLGPMLDAILKGPTHFGIDIIFGDGEMRFSVAEARVRASWGVISSDRFAGAVIRTFLLLANLLATIGSAWGFFSFIKNARHRS